MYILYKLFTYELNFLINTMGLEVCYFENLKCIYPDTVITDWNIGID